MYTFQKAFKFLRLVEERKKIRVKSLAKEMDSSERSIYRMIEAASKVTPIYLDNGVVIWGDVDRKNINISSPRPSHQKIINRE